MVSVHHAPRPETIKPARRQPRQKPPRSIRCVICDAVLASDHGVGDLLCSCHHPAPYSPRADARLDSRILRLLAAAWPEPLNVLRALGTDNRVAVHEAVCRIRIGGVPIVGITGVGYRLGDSRTTGDEDGRG
jgi:hypothetical protein